MRLRYIEPDRPRPFRTPFVPVVPILAILSCLWLMLGLPMITWIRFGIWLLIGLALYFRLNQRGKWASATYTEKMFMGLSLVAATVVALQISAGALQP